LNNDKLPKKRFSKYNKMRRALFSTLLAASDVLAATDCDNLQTAISGLQCEEKRTCSEGFTCNIHRKKKGSFGLS
jgi:hypothetical protein